MNITSIFLIIASYLIGAIPFGILLSRGRGIDVRSQGSCNIGATNVSRLLGKKLGVCTLLLDMAKGFLPMFAASRLLSGFPDNEATLVVALCGGAAILGHIFPVYLRFQGGKGVATALGVFLFLSPPAVLFSIFCFITTVFLSNYVSAGSLVGSAMILPALPLLGEPAWKLGLAFFVVSLIWIKHKENIIRLLRGAEKPWRKKKQGDT